MGVALSKTDIRKTANIVRQLSDDVKRGQSGCRSVPLVAADYVAVISAP